jgi:hypothetical protein
VQKTVTSFYEALQAGQIAATTPGATPAADAVLAAAGFKDKGGQDPNIPAPAIAQAPAPQAQAPAPAVPQDMPELQQADGAQQGIETPVNDGSII